MARGVVLAVLALCVAAGVPALAMFCPEQCVCTDGEEMEYSCTDNNNTVSIVAQAHNYINIDCMGGRLPCSLPFNPLGRNSSLPSLSIRACRMEGIRCVLAALAVTDVPTIIMTDVPELVDHLDWEGLAVSSLSIYTDVRQPLPQSALSLPLRSFRLSGGDVTLSGDVTWPARLVYLEVAASGVRALTPAGWRGLRALQRLNLFGNNISHVQDGAFHGLESLEQLSISTSQVQQLDDHVFDDLPSLKTFTMLRARLSELGDVFKGLQHLEKVSISNDVSLSLPRLSSPSLSVLSLSRCGLSSPPLLSAPRLAQLSLSHNNLSLMPVTIGMPQLVSIDLDYNFIESLPDDVLSGLKKLQELSIRHNRLKHISPNALRGAPSLASVSLSHNSLSLRAEAQYSDLSPPSPFYPLRELTTLDLSHNEISDIFEDWSQVLLQLKSLDLTWNKFTIITGSEIQFLALDTVVDLRHNNISVIDLGSSLLQDSPASGDDGRGVILLSDNPVNCNCHIYPLFQRLQGAMAYARELKFNSSDVQCSTPSSLQGQLLRDVNPLSLTCEVPLCPDNCSCVNRRAASAGDLTCSELPALKSLRALDLPSIWLTLKTPLATLDSLPESVTILNMTGLSLSHIPTGTPPVGLKTIDLTNNNLIEIPSELLNSNLTVYLAGNPIKCCDMEQLTRIADRALLQCTRCEEKAAVIAAGSVFLLIIFIIMISTVVIIKWRREAKVWVASTGWFAKRDETGTELYDAFISYAHGDEHWVREHLIPTLEEKWRVCVHYRDWEVGEMIPAQIARSVNAAKRTLAVVSKHFINSKWSKLEFQVAAQRALAERRPRLLVLLLDEDISIDKSLDPDLKAYLATSTYLSGRDPQFWVKLKRAMPPPRKNDVKIAGALNVALTYDGKLVNMNDKLYL